MGARDLIVELRSAGYSIRAAGEYLDITPAENVSSKLLQQLRQHKPDVLAILQLEQQEMRREKVLAMLATDLEQKRAVYVDTNTDPDNAILAIAIRYVATFEMKVSKANYDPWQLVALLDKAGTCHIH